MRRNDLAVAATLPSEFERQAGDGGAA